MEIPNINMDRLERRLESKGYMLGSNDYIPDKFIQIYVDGNPHLRLEDEAHKHWEILRDFLKECNEKGLGLVSDAELNNFSSKKLPLVKTDTYEVVGMGDAYFDFNDITVTFRGNSWDYGLGVNREHLEIMKKFSENWTLLDLLNR